MSEDEFQISEEEFQEFQSLVQRIEAADTEDFLTLAKLLGRDPKIDFAGADLSLVNLSSADLSEAVLSEANLSSAKVENTRFGIGSELSESEKLDLKRRGAIFADALGDRESAFSPIRR